MHTEGAGVFIGNLQHACKVVPSGRTFFRRMINLLSAFCREEFPIRLNREFHVDLSRSLKFLQSSHGYSFLLSPCWAPLPDLHVSSEVAGSVRYGAILGRDWFAGRWSPLQMPQQSFVFTGHHVPGKSNAIADATSHFEFQWFHQLAPYASPTATPVPPLIWAQLPVVYTKSANSISPMVWLPQPNGCIVQRSISSSISVL